MGADIYGWVETCEPGNDQWGAVFEIEDIVERSYGMFASLFGMRNSREREITPVGRFRAIAPGRGTPSGASSEYLEMRTGSAAVGETWVLWSELETIDWDEEGQFYTRDDLLSVFPQPEPGMRHERRGDYLNSGWDTLLNRMAQLAKRFGADNVRLSVWFDQW